MQRQNLIRPAGSLIYPGRFRSIQVDSSTARLHICKAILSKTTSKFASFVSKHQTEMKISQVAQIVLSLMIDKLSID